MPRPSIDVPTARSTRSRLRSLVRRGLTGATLAGALLVAAAAPAPAATGPALGALPAATSTSARLTWKPPALTSPTTVTVSATKRVIKLASGRDYIVKMPKTPLQGAGGLIIAGGRNVVLIGGEIRITNTGSGDARRGLYLKSQSGTVHIEGLKITGSTLAEGINIDQRYGATVQVQNVRVDTVHGSASGHHADVLQTWGGPAALRVDRLTGYTQYQGFFLDPTKYGSAQPRGFDFRNVNIVGQSGSRYLLWRDGLAWPMKVTNVWAKPSVTGLPRGQFLRPDNATKGWGYVKVGVPSTGDFVPASRAGTSYVSPGYL